jgi:hypothetical protein
MASDLKSGFPKYEAVVVIYSNNQLVLSTQTNSWFYPLKQIVSAVYSNKKLVLAI